MRTILDYTAETGKHYGCGGGEQSKALAAALGAESGNAAELVSCTDSSGPRDWMAGCIGEAPVAAEGSEKKVSGGV
jgi:hypothetical protein